MTHLGRISMDGQTTIPKAIRDALGLSAGMEVEWRIEGDHAVLVQRRDSVEELAGSLSHYAGKPLNDAEINEAMGSAIREDDERIKRYGATKR